ncbi:penicillin acylase family protein [Paracoccus fistulariae]|uniref:Penicillin acylase family protein n=1 Tax=Paracoccus fistulariae TaxID=658446 RepID=A0ABY7SNG3_9RHOB|nr:penicillin acylase family protein [Paracoccus fistulariae]MDB6179922.1 penicillin acylase family protein [Paracoccus fistulariae]WCR08022.1 penicillin acylase family protein [Paracoccus fistulariae]
MLTLFRWLLRATVALIVLLVLAMVLTWYFATRSIPDYNATYRVQGIAGPVEIVRSTENVPHIFGSSDADVYFALGLAHAQDRLFQMTLLRRAAQGRLSEIYGRKAFPSDDLARRLELYRNAVASVEDQDQATLAALRAYAAGVNEWIGQVNAQALGRGAPEFFLRPQDISYWQPADSLAILKLLAAASSHSAAKEVLRARLSLAWPDRGTELLRGEGGPAALPDYAELFPNARFPAPESRARNDGHRSVEDFLRPGDGLGANGFAAMPDRTAAHGTLLANDPQAPLVAPSLYYLARMQLSSGGVIGATIPGMPVILSGRNPQLAWGLTPAPLDDADIAMEEIQPGSPDRYRAPTGWADLQSRREVIRVLDEPDRNITLRFSRNGPLVPGLDPGLADITPAGFVPALRWTGSSGDDTTMSALVGLMGATDANSAARIVEGVVAPAFAVTLADNRNIRQLTVGAAPERAANHPTGGALPVPGWQTEADWTDIVALDGSSQATDNGIVLATEEMGPVALRRGRLGWLLQDREIHSRDSFIAAQLDIVSPAARTLLPIVGAELWFTGEPAASGTPERQRQDALNLLAEWDGAMSEHLPEPLIYSAWMSALQDRLIRDELGPVADDIHDLHPGFIDAVFRNRDGAAAWCDIVQSAPTEDCTTIARQALDRAILTLSEKYGPDVTSWRWGDAHQVRQAHPVLGQIAGLRWVVNLTQSLSGGPFSVARTPLMGHGTAPFEATTGPGYRGVYDLADPDSSVFIISTGQSGHPLSRHYDDLADLWRRGEYIGMSLDPGLARAAATGITRLEPATN